MLRSNHVQLWALVVSMCLCGAARVDAQSSEPPAQAAIASEFIRVLQDSGVAAALPMAAPRTRALKGFAPNMEVLRGKLIAAHATLTLSLWNAAIGRDSVERMHLTYEVKGAGAPSKIEFWIEGEPGHYLVNTISLGPPNPDGESPPLHRADSSTASVASVASLHRRCDDRGTSCAA